MFLKAQDLLSITIFAVISLFTVGLKRRHVNTTHAWVLIELACAVIQQCYLPWRREAFEAMENEISARHGEVPAGWGHSDLE